MPIPKPRDDEERDEFITRCMGDESMVTEYTGRGQRAAVCQSTWQQNNNSPNFIFFSINFTSLGRIEIINGVEHKVYPITMLVEGVHHGAVGNPTFYSAEILQRSATQWNGVPITVHHPQDTSGNYISANSPGVPHAGFIRNAFCEDGKLKAEACVDIAKATAIRPNIIDEVDAGGMEVSTGLYAGVEETAGQWNTEDFNDQVVSIDADHLALLPGQTGACSVDDGCGIRPHVGNEIEEKALSIQDYISSLDTEELEEYLKVNLIETEAGKDEMDRYDSLLIGKRIVANETSHDDTRGQLMQYVDTLDVRRNEPGDSYKINYVESVYQTYFIYREETETGTRLYKQLYSENNGRINIDPAKVEVFKKTDYLPVQGNSKGENQMANENPCCPDKVRALIANEHTTFTEAETEWLEGMNEDQLGHFEAMAEAAAKKVEVKVEPKVESKVEPKVNKEDTNTMEGFLSSAPPEFRRVINAGLRQLDKARSEMITTIMANDSNKFTDDQLKAMPDDTLAGIAVLSAKPAEIDPVDNPFAFLGRGGAGIVPNAGETEEEPYVPKTLTFN